MHRRDFDKRANGENVALEDGLHGDFDAAHKILREQPYHRTIINMSAAGYTTEEIAAFTGRNRQTVSNTLRQPWARTYLIQEAKKTVQEEIRQLLEQEAIPSIRKLVEIRVSVGAGTAADKGVAKQAADSLLDRFLGKPTQPISTTEKPPSEMSDEELKAQVQRELATAKN